MYIRAQGFTRSILLPSLLLTAFVCSAAKPVAQEAQVAPPGKGVRAAQQSRAVNLPSSVLDPVNEKKIHVSSTDSKGECPAGATKLDKCSGVYANGNSWEISPCCRTVTD